MLYNQRHESEVKTMNTLKDNNIWKISNETETHYFISAERIAQFLHASKAYVYTAYRANYKVKGYNVSTVSLDNVTIIENK